MLRERLLLILILAVAAAARLWFFDTGVPHAVGIDEPQVVDRAIRILRTGDWNPHVFDYPTLVIYLHAGVAIVRFLWGALQGEWGTLDAFSIAAIYGTGRIVAASIGVVTVWLTYRLGRDLVSAPVALLAAAQLAVRPLHVRESHFILTDVPMTALTTLAVWLTVRASDRGRIGAYAWAGAACGLAAAAKYNGGIVLFAPLTAWLLLERAKPDALPKLAAIVGAAAAAFLAGAPFTVLDMPAFLDGFAAQFARFAAPAGGAEAPWSIYLKHLSPPWARQSVPLALAGIVLLLWRPATRRRAAPAAVFALAFYYMLATHSHVFGRYALPLLPMICLFSSVVVVELIAYLRRRFPSLQRPVATPLIAGATLGLLLWSPTAQTIRWLDQYKRADTRTLAANWLKGNTPRGTRVAVENSGPTYLDWAGFRLAPAETLLDRPLSWYRARADYLVISAADLARYGDYVNAGPAVFQISPTSQRWGPPILIVRLEPVGGSRTPPTSPSPAQPGRQE